MKNQMILLKNTCLLICLLAFVACNNKELDDLYNKAGKNEAKLKSLEYSVEQMNAQLKRDVELAQLLTKRVRLTSLPSTDESGNYRFSITDEFNVVHTVDLNQGVVPKIELNEVDQEWIINDVRSGIAIDGVNQTSPIIRVNHSTKMWELSFDMGLTWVESTVLAEGTKGDAGQTPTVSINSDGKWVIGGVVSDLAAAKHAYAPQININNSTFTWTICEHNCDISSNWIDTGIRAQAKAGENGAQGDQGDHASSYIKNITLIGKTLTIIFSDDNAEVPHRYVLQLNDLINFKLEKDVQTAYEFGSKFTSKYTLTSNAYLDVFGLPEGWTLVKTPTDITITAPTHITNTTQLSGQISFTASDNDGNFKTIYAAVKIKIGSLYTHSDGGKGIVCWLNSKQNAKPRMRSIALSQGSAAWQVHPLSANALDEDNGQANMELIKIIGINLFPAFDYCAKLTGQAYLPAVNELNDLANSSSFAEVNEAIKNAGGTIIDEDTDYWTSSELNADEALSYRFKSKEVNNPSKKANHSIRAFFEY